MKDIVKQISNKMFKFDAQKLLFLIVQDKFIPDNHKLSNNQELREQAVKSILANSSQLIHPSDLKVFANAHLNME